jgi:predicted nucleic acid-binding protein
VIVVGDTSIFLNLCRVRQQDLLPALFSTVFAPPEVEKEFGDACARLIRFANLSFPAWVIVQPIQQPLTARAPWVALGAGESAALELAIEIRADAVLMDESDGREVAARLGITAVGVIGILIRAKNAGLLPAIAPILDEMQRDARFFLSLADRQIALRLAGELP